MVLRVGMGEDEKVWEMEGIKVIGDISKWEVGCGVMRGEGEEFEVKGEGWNGVKEECGGEEEEVE